ncbi:MAG: hypothetical protein AAF467_27755 [Actinomycetota bacterium]
MGAAYQVDPHRDHIGGPYWALAEPWQRPIGEPVAITHDHQVIPAVTVAQLNGRTIVNTEAAR